MNCFNSQSYYRIHIVSLSFLRREQNCSKVCEALFVAADVEITFDCKPAGTTAIVVTDVTALLTGNVTVCDVKLVTTGAGVAAAAAAAAVCTMFPVLASSARPRICG